MSMVVSASCSTTKEQKALVLYYSQTGGTKAVAEQVAALTGADIAAYDAVIPYDGTYDETIQRANDERASDTLPEITTLDVNVEDYDVIFIGFPVWYGTCALPTLSLINQIDLNGKTVVPFCTFGSGGLETSTATLKSAFPDANFIEGYGVRAARIDKVPVEVERFLAACGFIEGEVEVLGEFSEQKPVTEEEAAIFDAACSSYMMPLGTAVEACSRKASDRTEYIFVAEGQGFDGGVTRSKVYVTVENAEGSTPEFTKVVR